MIKLFLNRNYILLVFIIVINFSTGCDIGQPVKVGFSGQLTGPHANMGVSGRDGILLAIDKINAAGGIAGKPVELLVRDDMGTPEGARAADQKLINTGVVAILGHMTSSQSMAALPVVEKSGMVLLSPTTSTPRLTRQIDHFFRVIDDSGTEARFLARHIIDKIKIKRVAAIYDKNNAAYTNTFLNAFRDEFQKNGGNLTEEIGYSSDEKPFFGPLVTQLQASEAKALVIISSALDGALIAQQSRLHGWGADLFGSGWTLSAPLIENGGKAVEGMSFVCWYDFNSQAPEFLKFQKEYQNRFKQSANFMAGNAYESMLVLAAALEKTDGRAKGLAQALPGTRIDGLMETIALDEYGDGVRTYYQIMVEDGNFITKGRLKE